MLPLPREAYTIEEVRELDNIARNEFAIKDLMQRAGAGVFATLQETWPDAKALVVVCGKGNNAGDGYVVAHLAHEAGLQVGVYTLVPTDELSGDALDAAHSALDAGVVVHDYEPDALLADLEQADVVVDALLGTGIAGEISGDWAKAIQLMNMSKAPILAIDVPSGLNANSGYPHGLATFAHTTVTLVALKRGLLTGAGSTYCGQLVYNNCAVPDAVFASHTPSATRIELADLQSLLPVRPRDAHKGLFGHVLIVGGDYGMSGAALLAGMAALRVGAGKVSLATRAEHTISLTSQCPTLMCHAVDHENDVEPLLDRATVVVLGPGLGQTQWAERLFHRVLATELPVVLDADGLNLMARHKKPHDALILTPHVQEAARLLDTSSDVVLQDRFAAADALQQIYDAVVVLKGAGTLIQAAEQPPFICDAGNPGMAVAGMGDVLSGVIGGLCAQRLSLLTSAKMGVCVHALAGDLAASEGGERGTLPSDLMVYLRQLVNLDPI